MSIQLVYSWRFSFSNVLHSFFCHCSHQAHGRFNRSACHRLNAIYQANKVDLLWHLEPRSLQSDNSVPDFVLMRSVQGAHGRVAEEVMIGEGKVRRTPLTATPAPCIFLAHGVVVQHELHVLCSSTRSWTRYSWGMPTTIIMWGNGHLVFVLQ